MIPILDQAALHGLLADFKAQVAARLGDRLVRVVLFGSYANGTVSEDSDIDILLLVSQRRAADSASIWAVAAPLMIEHQVVLSPLCLGVDEFEQMLADEKILALDVEREGVPV